MPSHDDDLVTRAKRGDEAAWRELYEAHAGRLEYWLRSRPCADAAADVGDIAAEAWLTAAHKIGTFSGNTSDFVGWLFRIARSINLNAHRRSQRRATVPRAVNDAIIWGTVADGSSHVDGADWTRRLLTRLPPREAEVVLCLDVIGLDVSTTGTLLGISGNAVRVSHHRGLRQLRRILQSPTPARPTSNNAPA